MQHLTAEALARRVGESPTCEERVHLDACSSCSAELEALRAQTAALAELPRLSPPAAEWTSLQTRLADEGLIRVPAGPRAGWGFSPLLRAATYVVLFLLGGVGGVVVGQRWNGDTEPESGSYARSGPSAALATDVRDQAVREEATRELRDAEAAYVAALARYGELSGVQPEEGDDPVARLAALEGIVLTTRAALEEAPADPVINGYHLAALGQREAMLRQISRTATDPWF